MSMHDERPHGARTQPEPPPLPPEVAAALAEETPSEQARLQRAWHLAGHLSETEPPEAALRTLGAALWPGLEAAAMEAPRAPLRRVQPNAALWLAAACVVLLAGLGLVLWLRPATLTAPPGAVTSATLPDGSRVELSSRSTLTYARRPGKPARTVTLRGEAFFDVARHEQPFTVRTFNARVTARGTRFNVRAWPEGDAAATEVTLASGRVEVAAAGRPEQAVTLQPGQTTRVAAADTVPTLPLRTNLDQALAWRTGGFVFTDEPLGVIVREMERRFGVEIRAAPDLLEQDSLTVLLFEEPAGAEAILRQIRDAYGTYGFRPIPGGYELYRTDEP